jgi:diguanylate cyclase (GGDEF)-like protein/PAS domain S-box-containing protein
MRPVFDSLMRGELERSEYWENEVLTGDGERRLIAFRNGYLQDEAGGIEAILSSGIDITDQRRTEQALRSQEQWLHSLLEAIPTPVFYKDTEGRYLGCNSAFAEFLGLSPAEITGRTVFDLAPPELAETYHAADQALFREGGTQEYESSVIGAAGLRRDVLFHKSVFYREDGELGGLIGVAMDITERKEMEAALRRSNTELERMANHDRLTGAYNRRQFDDFLLQEVQRAERHGTPLALIMLDIDHFKWVNDAYGHLAGDEILQQLVSRVGGRLRTSDLLARWGGEEFMVLLPETDEAGALTLAEDLRRTVEDAPVAGPGTITISLGVAEHRHGQHLKDLTKRVDDALYAAKAGGRNRVATA